MTAGKLRRHLPLLLLALALSSLFVQRTDTGAFHHRVPFHNWNSAKFLALAENVSLERRLLLFEAAHTGADGATSFLTYGRFPFGGYVLIQLAMLPFEGDLAAKLLAARMLMLALFCGGAMLAFDALRRIAADPYVALAATLLAFSSYQLLLWSDAVFTENMVDLFGVMLVFHGMVRHWQGAGIAQLLAKTGAALLLGWHVYALLLPYAAIGLATEAARAWRGASAAGRPRALASAATLLRSHYLSLSVAAVLLGTVLLGFNLANEHGAYEGDKAFAELPTVHAVARRFGFDARVHARIEQKVAWPEFLASQSKRVAKAVIPYALYAFASTGTTRPPTAGICASLATSTGLAPLGEGVLCAMAAALGAVAAAACLGWLLCTDLTRLPAGTRVLLATLTLAGLAWALPMRYQTATHVFEGIYYVGIALALFTLAFMGMRQLGWDRLVIAVAVAAAPLFVLSATAAKHAGWPAADGRKAATARTMLRELEGIRRIVLDKPGKTVFAAYHTDLARGFDYQTRAEIARFALAGSSLRDDASRRQDHGVRQRTALMPGLGPAPGHHPARALADDFIVVFAGTEPSWNNADPALLTPNNRSVLLYDGRSFASIDDFYRHWYRWQYATLAGRDPAARSEFDVHLLAAPSGRHEIAYLKQSCTETDVLGRFFVDVSPKDPDRLPAPKRHHGFDEIGFRFDLYGTFVDDWCMARFRLPHYNIRSLTTGRYASGGTAWEARIDGVAFAEPATDSALGVQPAAPDASR